jgi:hypothetical protein
MELSRLHADASWLGDAGLVARVEGDRAVLSDDEHEYEYAATAAEMLRRLEALDDGAGWAAVLGAMEGREVA